MALLPSEQHEITSYSDACWGSQTGNSVPDGTEIALFKVRSMFEHLIVRCGGPISWKSIQQRRTALSSAESEIMATNECAKDTLSICLRASDLQMTRLLETHPGLQ